MDRRFYELAAEHAKSPAHREMMRQLIARSDDHEKLEHRLNETAMSLRAKREGISLQQIRAQLNRALAQHAVGPEERARYDAAIMAYLSISSDDEIIRCAYKSEVDEYEDAARMLNWKKLPDDNRPLQAKRVAFLAETKRMLEAFAATEHIRLT